MATTWLPVRSSEAPLVDTFTTHTGGTTQEILSRITEDPANPAQSKVVGDSTTGHKIEAHINSGLVAAKFVAGEIIVAASVHVNWKSGSEGKRSKYGIALPAGVAENAEPVITVAQGWASFNLPEAHAKELTKAVVEELTLFLETSATGSGKTYSVYELGLLVSMEPGPSGNPISMFI